MAFNSKSDADWVINWLVSSWDDAEIGQN